MIPAKIKKILISNPKIAELSRIFTYAHNFLYLGRGYSFPVALEGALKLKEISYIHAEGYPAAEMKHGPIALIDAEMPVVVIATHNAMYEKIMSNIQEIKARKGKVIALVTEGDTVIGKLADDCIELPETLECLEPLIATVPLQLLAYHVAICKGKNVDQPRNLAKSVKMCIRDSARDVSTVVWCMIPVRLKESWFPSWCAKRMWRKQCKPSSRRRTPAR